MEIKKGDKTFNMPVLGWLAGAVTLGAVAIKICDTVISCNKK